MSAKRDELEVARKLKSDQESKAKSQRNLPSPFGVSVSDMDNILRRRREYGNLGEPLG